MLDSFEKNSQSLFVLFLKKPTAVSKADALHYFLQKSTIFSRRKAILICYFNEESQVIQGLSLLM